jgi:hypothetical protein
VKLGVNEPKKVVALAVLVVGGGYLFYANVIASPRPSAAVPAAATVSAALASAATPVSAPVSAPRAPERTTRSRVQSDEFHPVFRSKRPEDRPDPTLSDPTLRLDLLAKVQQVSVSGDGRNVFQFYEPPVKPLPKPEPVVTLPPPVDPTPPPPPPPPPLKIPLRYYGFSSVVGSSAKTAYFLDGDDIVVAKEGEMVKRRYKVVRIGTNSVVMEDSESKRQQTLPLEEAAG